MKKYSSLLRPDGFLQEQKSRMCMTLNGSGDLSPSTVYAAKHDVLTSCI